MKKQAGEILIKTSEAQAINKRIYDLYIESLPLLGPNWHRHATIGLKVEGMARILYWNELYKKIVDVPGVICEFGVQYGASLVNLLNLRSVYEPFNHSRTVVGFDTFQGFPSVSIQDGDNWAVGDYSTSPEWEKILGCFLEAHEAAAPMPHIRKHELVKGDISETFPVWLEQNPHAIVSMAIFDTDLYQPTLDVLKQIRGRLTKGSLLVFDELSCKYFSGETIALREVIGTENLRLRRSPLQPFCAWAIWGE